MQERRETRVLLRRTGDSAPRGPAACTGARLGKERHTRMHQGAHPKLSQHCSSPACVSHVRLSVTPWTGAYQAPLSTELSRQEYWSGSPFHPPGDLPNPGIEPRSPTLQADSLPAEPGGKPNIGVGSLSLLQGSSQSRNRTWVSCIAGGFFTS